MGQLDWAREEENGKTGSKASGLGWMIGPYIAGQIFDQNLFYEARLSYGQSNNSLTPIGTYKDNFTTQRLHISGKLTGEYKMVDYVFSPEISLSWYQERQQDYIDSLANTISGQTVSMGEMRFSPKIKREIQLGDNALIIPEVAVSGIWNFDVNEGEGAVLKENDIRARIDLGLSVLKTDSFVRLNMAGHYDGIGIPNYQSWGGKLKLVVPTN
jgi:hypothetical protein